jgi:hypothetical protein
MRREEGRELGYCCGAIWPLLTGWLGNALEGYVGDIPILRAHALDTCPNANFNHPGLYLIRHIRYSL